MTRQQKIKKNEAFRLNYERNYAPRIAKVLEEIRLDFVDTVKKQGIAAAQSRLANNALFEEKIARVMIKLYIAAGRAKAYQVYQELTKEPIQKSFSIDGGWIKQIVEFFTRTLFNTIVKTIYANTRNLFETKMQEMIQNGYSIDWLVQEVTNPTLEAYRARVIARTESSRAINYGADIAARDSGFDTTKEWVSVHDDRTRHSHILLDGTIIGVDESFKPGLKYPGDPEAPAAETVNCRCYLEYRAVRDSEGLLKPKFGLTSPTQSQRRELEKLRILLEQNQELRNPFATSPIKL